MLPPTNSLLLEDAVDALNRGELARALDLARRLRDSAPSPQALYVELMAMVGLGMVRDTQRLLQKNKEYLEQWADGVGMAAHVQGRIAMRQGKPEMAVPQFRAAYERLPKNQACMLDYAEALFQTSQFQLAHGVYLQALVAGPASPLIYNNLAACALRMQQFDQAFAYSYVGWTNHPNGSMARQIGHVMLMSENVAGALQHFKQAFALGEQTLECLHGMAECYRRMGWYARSVRYLKRALKMVQPQFEMPILVEIMRCYEKLGRPREALPYCERMVQLNPNDFGFLLNIGNIYQTECDYDTAMAWCDKAEKLAPGNPDIQYFRGFIQLLQGDWKEGWRNYEARWKTVAFKEKYAAVTSPVASPEWDGKASLKGKLVMALCEQGAGDLIQFGLYCKHLVELGATVDLLSPPSMTELLSTMPWIRSVHDNYFRIPPHDYHVSLMTLPLYFGATPETVPTAPKPFLTAPRKRERFSDRFTVALSWQGDAKHGNDAWRSMPTHFLYDLIKAFPDVQFVSLQFESKDRVLTRYLKAGMLVDGMKDARSFTDTAAAIDAVDLVISVDTATAHVAAAMNKPIWMLLSEYFDWRWLGGDTDTKWYPSMRIFRQKKMHDWRELLSRVAAELRPLVDLSGRAISTSKTTDKKSITKKPTAKNLPITKESKANADATAATSPLRKKLRMPSIKKSFS